ncbi:YugN-like family protein [Metabacillus sp. GX 13764]|uniref:YugN-like family protein n=1 Tax=Metabacillus kandeliae TaxID=2900151 RepID=UPI001E645985|nr:YugN-like family protein [Metabacillus kandeliae]MCD7035765.1 YugN-like family protein [Metabacillus kandeliae]
MFEIPSKIENKIFKLHYLEEELKPLGYVIGSGWDYDNGYFDYKIDDEDGVQYLRVPFQAVDGELDTPHATVRLGTPFLLSHQYKKGLDDHAETGNITASFNQFSEPHDKDSYIADKYHSVGRELALELESVLLGASMNE